MEELYIFGDYLEIKTDIGTCYFIKVKDYPKLMKYIQLLYIDKNDIISEIKKEYKKYFKDFTLLDLINHFYEDSFNLKKYFNELFEFIFHEDVFYKIKTDEELNYYRNLIIEMNCIKFEKPNPNPEIEYYNKLERLFKEKNGEVITMKSMITSVGLYTNPFELTIYQLYAYFDRINWFQNNNATTLFKTVDGKIDIIPWFKDSDIKNNNTSLSNNDKDFISNHMGMLPIDNKNN